MPAPCFDSQGQKSTGPQSAKRPGLDVLYVLETKHLWEHTRIGRAFGNTLIRRDGFAPDVRPVRPGGRVPGATSAAPAASARSLPRATSRDSGTMPQLVHGIQPLGRDVGQRGADRGGDVLRASRPGRWRRRSPRPARPCLPAGRSARAGRASWRIRATPGRSPSAASSGKVCSYCRHFVAQRLLPVDVGLDAVAVADVDGGRAGQALRGALERRHAPVAHLVEVDVERGLVELDRRRRRPRRSRAPPRSGSRRTRSASFSRLL